MSRDSLLNKAQLVRANVDKLAHIPQATYAGHLPAGAAKRFAPIVGFRNRVVHLYDRIDPEIVHRVVTERRRDILDLLDLLLAIEQD